MTILDKIYSKLYNVYNMTMMMNKKRLTKSRRKVRDEAVYETFKNRPDFTYEDLARMFGLVSRQHAWYIVQKEKLKEKGGDKEQE